MTTDTGRIVAVNVMPLGDELVADTLAGATSLTVNDAADFAEDGGYVELNGETLQYLSADDETGVITLAGSTTVDAFEGDTVTVWDMEPNAPAVEYVAQVKVDGDSFNDDALEVTIPHNLVPYLPEGIRENGGEYVTVEWRGDSIYLADILQKEPSFEAAYVPAEATGNKVYRGDNPPWNDGDTTHAADDGDVWYNTSSVTNEDGTVTQRMTPYVWDGVNAVWVDASDPEVDLISGVVDDNSQSLDGLSQRIENVNETATNARDLASTADGRVSFSDYDPDPDDVTYYAEDANGNLILDANGNPVLMARNPGSVWFTRTRARINLCANPSFETDTAGWTVVGGTGAQFDPADPTMPIGGIYGYRIVNDAASTSSQAEWRPSGVNGLTVEAGQSYSASVFGLLETGVGLGAYAIVSFYDSTGTYISETHGPSIDLVTDDWREMEVNGVTPPNATLMMVHFRNPNAGDVWLIDGCLIEQAEYTGRYFDGDYDFATWGEPSPTDETVGIGTPHASASHMRGGQIVSVFELLDNAWKRLDFTATTQYAGDAGDLTIGTLDPDRIGDNSLAIDKRATNFVKASEALTAGNLVNVWDNGGLFMVRKASADAADPRPAHGFVLDTVSTGTAVAVYTEGYNPGMADLKPGRKFLSTTAGEATDTVPTATGAIVQRVGVASDAKTLHFIPATPVRLT